MNPTNSTGYNLKGPPSGNNGRFKPFREGVKKTGIRDVRSYTQRTFTPQQMKLLNQDIRMVGKGSYLQRLAGGDQELFNQIEAPAFRQFAGLQGNIASRFSGKGDLGARNSSGFQNQMTDSASNFAQELQAQRQRLQQGAIKDLMGYSQILLEQRPYDQSLIQKGQKSQSGGFSGAATGALSGAAAGAPLGPWGAAAGGVIGGISGYLS
jgi:hypothetical protein